MTQVSLANHLKINVQRINDIIRDKPIIILETAWLLSQTFKTTPQF